MHLVSHRRTATGEYVSEWLLAGIGLCARIDNQGNISELRIAPIAIEQQPNPCTLSDQDTSEGRRFYLQALALLGRRLSIDDPLQEAVVVERLRLEQAWLACSTWRDDRPCDDTAIPLRPYSMK